MLASLRYSLRRIGRLPRLIAAGGCLLLAVVAALDAPAARTVPAMGVPIVVARHQLSAGHTITATDLRVVSLPRSAVPAGTFRSVRPLVGRRVAVVITAREPLLPTRLLGPELITGLPPGTAALAVPVSGPALDALVRPGDRVDIYGIGDSAAVTPTGAGRLGTGLTVLAVLPQPGTDAVPGTASSTVVVAADRVTAERITRVFSRQMFAAVLDPP